MGCGVESGSGRAEGRSHEKAQNLPRVASQQAESRSWVTMQGKIGRRRCLQLMERSERRGHVAWLKVVILTHSRWVIAISQIMDTPSFIYRERLPGSTSCVPVFWFAYLDRRFFCTSHGELWSHLFLFFDHSNQYERIRMRCSYFLSSLAGSQFPIPGRLHTDLIMFYVC